MNVIFLHALAREGMCLPSRCLAMGINVTLCYMQLCFVIKLPVIWAPIFLCYSAFVPLLNTARCRLSDVNTGIADAAILVSIMCKQLSLQTKVTTSFYAANKDGPITRATLLKVGELELWVRIQLGALMYAWVSSVLYCPE
jgi:hypothetical protein